MFGEDFFKKTLGIKNDLSGREVLPKGSEQNPYSKAEFDALTKEQFKKEQRTYFNGYVNNTFDSKIKDINYFNFVEKDSNHCTVNLSPSQRRTFARLHTPKNENSQSSFLSVLVKDGDLTKKMVIKIGYDLPLETKKEIVDAVYRKIDNKNFLSSYKKWTEEAKIAKEEECREDLVQTVAGIIRNKVEVPEDDPVNIQII